MFYKLFRYYSTFNKKFNDSQYKKIIEQLNLKTDCDDNNEIDRQLLSYMHNIKPFLCKHGIYTLSILKNEQSLKRIFITVHYKNFLFIKAKKNKGIMLTVNYRQQDVSEQEEYIDVNTSHFFNDKYLYLGDNKIRLPKLKKIYTFSEAYNISLSPFIFVDEQFSKRQDGTFNFYIELNVVENFTVKPCIMPCSVDSLLHVINEPEKTAHHLYFKDNAVDLETFKTQMEESFKILEMMNI